MSAREGGLLLKQVPPYSTEHGGGENVVLQRIPKLGGENRAFKPPNGYSEQVPYGKICSRSLHCTPQFSARRYARISHGNFLADLGIGSWEVPGEGWRVGGWVLVHHLPAGPRASAVLDQS